MRQIIFRGKRIDNGEWVFGDLIRNLIYDGREKEMRIGDIYFEHNGDIHGTAVCKVIPETVGQFTGLTDKNGKKIFEGDIVKSCFAYENGKTLTVEFKSSRGGFFPYACGDGCGCCEVDTYSPEYTEVVGNIYDEKGF